MEIIKTNKTWAPEKKSIRRVYEYDAYTKEEAVPSWWNYDNHALIETTTVAGTKGYKKFCKAHNVDLPESGCPIVGCNHKVKE